MRLRPLRIAALLAYGTSSPVTAATAPSAVDGELSEVIVTAARQGAQSLQSVPMSITALDPEALNRQGVEALADIARNVAGLSVLELGGGQNSIVVRGINSQGTPDPTNVEDQALVFVYLDDTPISLAGATPDIRVFDLERLEFIRGPQGTLYGNGAMAGTIRYITQKPDSTHWSGSLESGVADTDGGSASYSLRGMLNAPLIEHALALRVSAYGGRDGGYVDNVGTGTRNANRQDNTQARAALRFDAGGPLTLDASYFYGNVRTGGNNDVFGGLGPYQFDTDAPESYHDRLQILNFTGTYATPWFDVTSSTSYSNRKIANLFGFQYGAAYFFGLPPSTVSTVIIDNGIDDFSQELRLSSHGTGALKWQTGMFFEHQHRKFTEDIPTAGLDDALGINSLDYGAFRQNDQFSEVQTPVTRQLALFGELTYSPAERWDLTAGLREFRWRQSFTLYAGGPAGALGPGQPLTTSGDSTANGTNPRFNAAFHVTHDLMLFAEAARGFRYGGINQPVPPEFCGAALAAEGLKGAPITYGPDHLWTYSFGEKSEIDEKRITLNATAFYTRWSKVQTRHDLTCGYFFEQNTGTVRSAGLELETNYQVTPALRLGINGSYTNAAASGAIPDLGAPDGARVPYFPRTIVTLMGGYTWKPPVGELALQADYNYRSYEGTEFDTSSPLYRHISATRVLDGALSWRISNTEWTLYGRNLTDARIVSAIEPNTYAPFQPGDAVYLGRPRTLGLKAKVSF
jgi:outer membrane receptor protein involved in Fe transport